MDLFSLIKKHCKNDNDEFLKQLIVYNDELKELKKRKFRKILEMEYQLGHLGKDMEDLKELESNYKNEMLLSAAKRNNNLYCWITINPKPDIDFETFRKKVDKLVNRKMFTDYCYVYEQRGSNEDELGKGFHTHILATRLTKYKPNKVARNIRNTCKNLVGDSSNNNQVNIQFIGEEYAADKKEYILGKNKTGEGKDKKQDMDVIWRKKNNLNEYYNAPQKQTNEQ